MYKIVIFAFVVMMAAAALSAPSEELEQHEFFEATVPAASVRLPRATCDLLSAFGVADSACAAHCLGMGRKGGWCEKGVCHCRR